MKKTLRRDMLVCAAHCAGISMPSIHVIISGGKRARHYSAGKKVGVATAGVLAKTVTHSRQTSLMTSRPARRNYKTGRAGRASAVRAVRRSGGRTAARPRRANSVTYRGRRRDAGARAGTRARGERRYGARAQVL
nr:uncharacterized protein LOC128680623 [Plodia interpunctella]